MARAHLFQSNGSRVSPSCRPTNGSSSWFNCERLQLVPAALPLVLLLAAPLMANGPDVRKLKGHQGSFLGVSSSPDGKLLASCSRDKTIKLWNPATGELQQTLTEHTADVYDVCFSPRGDL